jgi:hypothetical protein
MFLSFVNKGLYTTINFIYDKFFKVQKKLLIFIALICPCFSLFHLYKHVTTLIADWISEKIESILSLLDRKLNG